jgi:hypothetical protein
MMMDQLMRAKSIETSANKNFEEKRISKQDKDDLEKAIVREAKNGWQIKARSHD